MSSAALHHEHEYRDFIGVLSVVAYLELLTSISLKRVARRFSTEPRASNLTTCPAVNKDVH